MFMLSFCSSAALNSERFVRWILIGCQYLYHSSAATKCSESDSNYSLFITALLWTFVFSYNLDSFRRFLFACFIWVQMTMLSK